MMFRKLKKKRENEMGKKKNELSAAINARSTVEAEIEIKVGEPEQLAPYCDVILYPQPVVTKDEKQIVVTEENMTAITNEINRRGITAFIMMNEYIKWIKASTGETTWVIGCGDTIVLGAEKGFKVQTKREE